MKHNFCANLWYSKSVKNVDSKPTWWKLFLSSKIVITNKLYQLYWNIISVQIFGILSLLKMLLLSQLGENLFCKVSRWQGQAIFSTLERHYIGDDFVKILRYFHLYLLKYFSLSSKKSNFFVLCNLVYQSRG